jgi:pyruvate-formate lyase-activating enzyme
MKILLVYPPWLRLFGLSSTYFPLNLGYLAAELRKHGYETIIYDGDFDSSNKTDSFIDAEKIMTSNFKRYMAILQDLDHPIWQKLRQIIETVGPDIVGITSMTAAYGSAINVAKCAKWVNKDIVVILGGVHPTLLPEQTIKEPEVDIVVIGEAEIKIPKLVAAIEKKDLSSIGYQYRNGKYIVNSMPGSAIEDINSLEFPARDLLLNVKDFPASAFGTLMASRGCPFQCIFCSSHKMFGRKVRFRTAPNIIEEILTVHRIFGTVDFHFEDDTFTLKKDLILEFCKCLKEEDMKISWSCPTRVDFITPEIVREMKSAGCSTISLGIESGSEETLNRIRKNITLNQIRNAVKIIKDAGIRVMGYFVFGFPWETEEHFKMTLDFIEELDMDIIQHNFAVPLPGTELYEIVESGGILPPHETPIDWSHFYQHSPRLPFSKMIDQKSKASIMEYIETRIGAINRKKAMLRHRRFARDSRGRRIKYYLQHPEKLAERLYELIAE